MTARFSRFAIEELGSSVLAERKDYEERLQVMQCGKSTGSITGEPNAEKMTEGALAVVLERDVAAVFRSSEVVNTLLRSVIAAMR